MEDRGAWRAAVHVDARSQTRLLQLTENIPKGQLHSVRSEGGAGDLPPCQVGNTFSTSHQALVSLRGVQGTAHGEPDPAQLTAKPRLAAGAPAVCVRTLPSAARGANGRPSPQPRKGRTPRAPRPPPRRQVHLPSTPNPPEGRVDPASHHLQAVPLQWPPQRQEPKTRPCEVAVGVE